MKRLSIDEIIEHCERKTKLYEEIGKSIDFETIELTDAIKEYWEHKQVKEYLEELKKYKNAEEYNGGWIPCSERLPDDDSICIVTVEYPNNKTVVDYGWFDRIGVCWFVGMHEFRTSNIIAWQPLPEPYKE